MTGLKADLTFVSGLVGDIELNKKNLSDFTIYCLDMKPGFIDRWLFVIIIISSNNNFDNWKIRLQNLIKKIQIEIIL